MSTEKMVQELGKHMSRRKFLRDLGVGSIGVLLSLIGLPKNASAAVANVAYHCCNLCHSNGGAQSFPECDGTNNQSQKTKWCWFCDEGSVTYECCEYQNTPASCPAPCANVFASYGHRTGFSLAQ